MTRIETALARMFGSDDPASEMVEAALATPTGKALSDYLEAADAAVEAYGSDDEADAMEALAVLRGAFREAI